LQLIRRNAPSALGRRTSVELGNSHGKDKAKEDLSRGRISFRGRRKQRFVRVLAYVAINIRLIQNVIRDEARRAARPIDRDAEYYDLILTRSGWSMEEAGEVSLAARRPTASEHRSKYRSRSGNPRYLDDEASLSRAEEAEWAGES
jgi:hypothetical protein